MSTQPTAKPRAYRDFLTPLLHRRFTDASLLVLAVCWLEATLISSSSITRAWIPFGFTGLRTLLLFCPCLAIFIVRLTDLHFGERTLVSDWEVARREAFTLKTVFILLWYMYSAMFFGEVYIWSKGQEANLGWVDYGKAYERPRLNENPMILRCTYQFLAMAMTFRHVRSDIGNVTLRLSQDARAPKDGLLGKLPLALQDLVAGAGPLAISTLNTAVAGIVCTLLGYWFFLRQPALQFAYFFGTLMYEHLPQKTRFAGMIDPGTLLWQTITSSLLLSFLWTFSNAAFTAYVSRAPLKKDQPLTSEIRDNAGGIVSRSADPNASLITGLKSKKDGPHTFALWELYLICTRFENRRKTIFLEVDRSGGSSWSQISQTCLAELTDISSRIDARQKALAASSQPPAPTNAAAASAQPSIPGLPRIANEPVRQDDVLLRARPDLAQSISNVARSAGSHPQAENPLSPVARKAVAWSKNHVLTPQQQAVFTKEGITKETNTWVLDTLRKPFGAPFRESFESTVKAVVFGSPYSRQMSIIFAARSLAALLKASLVEDTCGVVAKDVQLVVRTLTGTILKIRQFVLTTPPSWTDVYFNERQRQVKDINDLLSELQQALEVVILAFSEYASAVGITKKELREAKEAVGMHERREMVKI